MSWQPIESAPKDGSTFIGVGLDFGGGPTQHVVVAVFDADCEAFFDAADGAYQLSHLTHWLAIPPLPAPPQEQQ